MVLIDSFPYDLMVAGEVTFASEVTSHPVERSSTISDHIDNKPVQLTLEVIVSDSPIGAIATHDSRRVSEVEGETLLPQGMLPLPSAEAYERLVAIRDEKRLVTIEIPVASRAGKPGKRTYKDMALIGLSDRHSAETAGGGYFNVTFQHVSIVDNKKVVVRTATPAGKSKTAAKGVGKTWIVDARIAWQIPAPGFNDWAVVDIQREQGGGKTEYRYTGAASSTFPYQTKADRLLPKKEAAEFEAFLAKEKQTKVNQQTKEIQLQGGKTQLPAGMDLNRIEEPAPPSNTPKQTPRVGGRSVGRR